MKVHYCVSVLCCLCSLAVLAQGPWYAKTASLPPLRITYAELQTILEKTASLLSNPRTGAPGQINPVLGLQLKHGETEVRIGGIELRQARAKLPTVATHLIVYMYAPKDSDRDELRVSEVEFFFTDHTRKLTVKGPSSDQVDAVFAALKADIVALSTPVGGNLFRTMAGMLLWMICGSILVIYLLAWREKRQARHAVPAITSAVILVMMVYMPFDQVFAGFSVSIADPSFMTRYASEITLAGLVLSVVGLIWPSVAKRIEPGNSAPKTSAVPGSPPAAKAGRKRARDDVRK